MICPGRLNQYTRIVRYKMTYSKMVLIVVCLIFNFNVWEPKIYNNDILAYQDHVDLQNFNGMPAWSPDGSQIAFVSGQAGSLDIWVMSADGSNKINLTAENGGDQRSPMWSPDGSQIVFESDQSGNIDIWLTGSNGESPINLTKDNIFSDTFPQWSPDGNYISFNSFISEDPWESSVRIYDIKNSSIKIMSGGTDFYHAIWSPDSKQIAFMELNDFIPVNLWLASVETGVGTQVISDKFISYISWSPTGNTIAVEIRNFPESEIWILDLQTKDFGELLASEKRSNYTPVWSPNGNAIAFESITPSEPHFNIWVMSADGKDPINLTSELEGQSYFPVWSPDGTHIAFESDNEQGFADRMNTSIWIINIDKAELVNLTFP